MLLFITCIVLVLLSSTLVYMIAFNTLWIIFETLNIQRLIVGTHSVLQQLGQLLMGGAKKVVPKEHTHKDAKIYNINDAINDANKDIE